MTSLKFKKTPLTSWGISKKQKFICYRPERQSQIGNLLHSIDGGSGVICRGAGLSYGDQSFNSEGCVILTERLNRLIDFNPADGQLICEPGVNFFDMLSVVLPLGWIPAVIPGSLYVTVGGAIANDVHGKNNTLHGSFGHHIRWMELYYQAAPVIISAEQNEDLFKATLGGLGVTGLVSKVCMQLIPATGMLNTLRQRVSHLDECIETLEMGASKYDYCSAWLDLKATSKGQTRGVVMVASQIEQAYLRRAARRLKIPAFSPVSLINNFSLRCFNSLYYHSCPLKSEARTQSIIDFNNPLDRIQHWNKLYGRRGLLQLQCLFPFSSAKSGIQSIQKSIARYHACAALCVVKIFKQQSLGLLSFPSPGITVAIDFPNTATHQKLIKECESIVLAHNGKVYLAKDACLDETSFKRMYPQYELFNQVRTKYGIGNQFRSHMSQRLGITR